MNKIIKGSIAGAAGIALLLGGAGTFALWNDSTGVNAGTITAGTLTTATSGAWTDTTTATATSIANPQAVVFAPGTKVTYTGTVTVTATGTHLAGNVSFNSTSITAKTPVTPANTALAAALVPTLVVKKAGTTVTGTTAFAEGTTTLDVVLTITLPAGTGVDNTAKLGAADLSAITFTALQVAP
ncbi:MULTISPECIES: alternate-type signal peptide domain-containing protein [unclassified Leifsonia]|uniref:alternate-type signal peptide domain-containing protein n=1 Tax=unclassified Leifsonia TaxID=2663824 RepID=UPI0006FB8B8A|nr:MULTISPECIES: alternate-type signal peptide domain-containing protein [unclassified Leifsonia]KQX05306.1 hypothetical protein ASC59_14170 [Leifsonia sp. Root1293]KRA08939.1 hypothetical protein ASD61_14170 [Leifsonia sp. Root60]